MQRLREERETAFREAAAQLALPSSIPVVEVVAHLARVFDIAERTVYRGLARNGWSSGRATRIDKGHSAVSHDQLVAVASILARGRNKRGQCNTPITEAARMATERGLTLPTPGHLGRLLRREGLSLAHLRAARAAIGRVSQYVNHVHFVDVSIALQWDFKDEDGRRLVMYSDAGARFYKPEQLRLVRKSIHRYTLTDHRSGAFFVRYYYSAGETAVDVVDFLFRAWREKPELVAAAYPFRGLPTRLVMDQGSAFRSQMVGTLLDELGIVSQYHKAKNAKASGSVERAHFLWQTTFEPELAEEPARDLDELNERAMVFCAKANAEREHTRYHASRTQFWTDNIGAGLVECPEHATFFALAATKPVERTLDNRLWISFEGRSWEISGEHIYPGQKVLVRHAPFTDAGIRVFDADERELAALALSFDEAGFQTNGRHHVWDDIEHPGATAPATAAQKLADAAADGKLVVALPKPVDDTERRLAQFNFAQPVGRPWEGTAALAAEPLLSSQDAREEVVRRLGRSIGEDIAWWRPRLEGGVTRSQLETLWSAFTGQSTAVRKTA